MTKIFEQCVMDGDLSPELLSRKAELDQQLNIELDTLDRNKSLTWVDKQKQTAKLQAEYDDIWEQELADAGVVVRPTFESTENWYDTLSQLNETLQTYKITYYEDGIKKSFTVQASNKAEAEQIGWSRVDADSVHVSEVVNEANIIDDPYAEFNLSPSVEVALENYPYDFEIDYDGYTVNWEEDAWDHTNQNHTTIPRSRRYDAFTYDVSPEELWETLRDIVIDEYIAKPGYIEKAIKHYKSGFGSWAQDRAEESAAGLRKIVADYNKFQKLWETDETAGEKLDIYIADHLDEFAVLFDLPLKEYYEERAKDSRW